jgi:hypothetical protein
VPGPEFNPQYWGEKRRTRFNSSDRQGLSEDLVMERNMGRELMCYKALLII